MKFTLGWLKDHLETEATIDEIAERLTLIGLEVEEVVDHSKRLAPFTVADVVAVEAHPNADKLKVCQVDTGRERVQVVCGAPNARTGMKGVFAPVGTVIPGTGLHLKPTKIRGVESNGMLVSEREMGLSDEHTGIIEMPADSPLGAPFAGVLGLGDPMIHIAITPNRQDCLGVRGVARDLAAAGLGRLKPLDVPSVPGGFASPIDVHLDFAEKEREACPLFIGRTIRGVKNGPSPTWLQRRLTAIGLRPISALVDITNYVTFDLGRPLHVFDADRLKGDLRVHPAVPGSRLPALDGKTYELDENVTAISDETGVQSLGGIMGGEQTGCTDDTANVFLEVALFDPLRTAANGRRLGIESDARYRFERGVDPAFVRDGAEIGTKLILDLCGGEASELVIAGEEPEWQRSVTLRRGRLSSLIGTTVPEADMARILTDLGFTPTARDGDLEVAVPSWRVDINGEADLIEEVTRIWGFEKIPSAPLPRESVVARPTLTPSQRRVRTARRTLATRGLVEAVTWSFVTRRHAELFGGGGGELTLANPISADLETMRPSPLPNLIAAAGRNVDRGAADFGLFEVGPQYGDTTVDGQLTVAAGIRMGRDSRRHWASAARPVDPFDAKADAYAVLAGLGVPLDALRIDAKPPSWYHPGRGGAIKLGPKNVLAWFGEIHPGVLDDMDVAGPVIGFEVFLDRLPAPRAKATTRPALRISDLQAVERDFAFVVDQSTPAETVVRAAQGADKDLIEDVGVFDVYSGAGIAEGKKSIAIVVRLQPKERTLTDAEIEAVGGKIAAAVERAAGGTLRT